MLDMIFPVQRSDIRASQGTTTFETQKVESVKIVGLAERVLTRAIFSVDREELRGNYLTAIGTFEAVQMVGCSKGAHKLTGQGFTTFLTNTNVTS
jgi:hypothetical protein